MKKYKYPIINLDCANCARKIEETLNKNPKLHHVVVNFNTSKISYETEEITLEEINKLVQEIEPESSVVAEEDTVTRKKEYHLSILIISVIIGCIGLSISNVVGDILVVISYILLLYRPFFNSITYFIKNKNINENFLITISCIGAFLVKQKMEGIMVIVLYTIGKILEEKAIHNTRKSIHDLLDIKQDYANLKKGKSITTIDVNDLKIGDIIVIKRGERVPVDGKVIKGKSLLDVSMLTGESELIEVDVSSLVLSGSINTKDFIEVEVTHEFSNSTVAKILELVEEATDKKANTETMVARISKVYTPIVLVFAILVSIFLPIFFHISISESIYRSLTFLVISCPCAIAISVPLSYFCGIGTASKNGILIKGSNFLDQLSHISKIVFDKTGTLTTGLFQIKEIHILDQSYQKNQVIEILRKGESFSTHPIAKSIMNLSKKKIDTSSISSYQEIPGIGIEYKLEGKHIKIGTKKVCNDCGIETNLHLNIDGVHVASIEIDDGIKKNVKDSITKIKELGIVPYMFTGDKKEVALEVGKLTGIDEIKYEMLPTDKYHEYEKLTNSKSTVAFVGDGINDAPVLKRADVGISMGNVGSSIAIDASDIVIMTDDISRIPKGIDISNYTNFIIRQNLIFAISVKILILLLSVFGYATMYLAVFADTGVTLLTILNTLRIMKKFDSKK